MRSIGGARLWSSTETATQPREIGMTDPVSGSDLDPICFYSELWHRGMTIIQIADPP